MASLGERTTHLLPVRGRKAGDGPCAQANVLAPNKHTAAAEAMWNGRLLDSETYIGGKARPQHIQRLVLTVIRVCLDVRFQAGIERS